MGGLRGAPSGDGAPLGARPVLPDHSAGLPLRPGLPLRGGRKCTPVRSRKNLRLRCPVD